MTVDADPAAIAASGPAARNRGRNIVAVASGKGGVGKTWFSISLAHALATMGQRVLLFDGDLGLANLDIQLGLMPKNDLGGVLSGRIALAQAVDEIGDTGIDVIAGRSGSGALADTPVSRLQMLADDLSMLAASYDDVIIDLGAGIERTGRLLASNSGRLVVITTSEPTALTDAYAFIKITHMERPETDIRVVVNMAGSTKEGERTYNTLLKACQGFLKITPPLLGIVRRDPKVPETIRAQSPLLTRHPTTEAAADIRGIAKALVTTAVTD